MCAYASCSCYCRCLAGCLFLHPVPFTAWIAGISLVCGEVLVLWAAVYSSLLVVAGEQLFPSFS